MTQPEPQSTHREIQFLDQMAKSMNAEVRLAGYLQGIRYRVYWENISRKLVRAHAEKLLKEVRGEG